MSVTERRETMEVIALLIATVALRLPFRSDAIFHCDSFGYCMGGLYQFVSHPPGFVGYCSLGWLVNQAIGNIHDSFVVISFVSSTLATLLVYVLARDFSLAHRSALAAAAAFGLSICVLYFGMLVLSYAVEGAAATAFGVLAWRGLKRGASGPLYGASIVWALSGALRATTSAFLMPLWLWMLWSSRRTTRIWRHVLLAAFLVAPWVLANRYLLEAKAGFRESAGKGFWDLQVMMPIQYQTDGLGIQPADGSEPAFHWPFVEVLAKAATSTGLVRDLHPEPSMARATRLTGVQLLKWLFYMAFALPAAVVASARLASGRSWPLSRVETTFLAAWVLPATAFFWFGHFGSFGYLQVMLAPASVASARCVAVSGSGRSGSPAGWRMAVLAATLVGVLFFVFARPTRGSSEKLQLADVLALQYSGPAIRAEYAVARSTIWKSDPRQLPFVSPDCSTDECLLATARRIQWAPHSLLEPPSCQVPPPGPQGAREHRRWSTPSHSRSARPCSGGGSSNSSRRGPAGAVGRGERSSP